MFAVEPGAELMDLWNAAAAKADSPWFLITENHCEASPTTIQRLLETIEANPDFDAARCDHGHVIPGEAGELGVKWFDEVYAAWDRPGEWPKLDLAGILVRRELYHAVGGLDSRYGLFAAMLFAARLDERGSCVGLVTDTGIRHVQPDNIDEHHGHTESWTRGECEARAVLDPVFSEYYFGHQPLLQNRRTFDRRLARRTSAILVKETVRAIRRPRLLPWLVKEFLRTLPAAVGASKPALLATRFTVLRAELAMRREWLPRRFRHRQFARGQEGVIRRTVLEWIEDHGTPPTATLEVGSAADIGRTPEHALTGFHGLERHADRTFRWTAPVFVIGLPDRGTASRLRIDTEPLWPGASSRLVAAYLDRRRLDPATQGDDGSLVIDLPAGGGAALTLLFRPAPVSSAEHRRLGIPVFALELQAQGMGTAEVLGREAAPAA